MATSAEWLEQLASLESQEQTGQDIQNCRIAMVNYLQALAPEMHVTLPSPLPDMTVYTAALSRWGFRFGTIADVTQARNGYIKTVIAASKPVPRLNRVTVAQQRLDAAKKAGAPAATVDALQEHVRDVAGANRDAAQKAVADAIAAKAPVGVVTALQKQADAAATVDAEAQPWTTKLAVLAAVTAPAWGLWLAKRQHWLK